MEMESLVNLILNSSVSIVVIVYFMFRDYKFISQLTSSIQQLVDCIGGLSKDIDEALSERSDN